MTKTFLIKRSELERINYSEDMLSSDRREKIAKIKRDEDKELGTCVELLLIYALRNMQLSMSLPLDIIADDHGKLMLNTTDDRPAVYFNLSHAMDYAACTISTDGPVGVDIEYFRVREILNPDKILHPDENTIFAFISNPNEKKKYFYECWVSKESYLKNLGIGLVVRPSVFMVNEDKLKINDKEITNNKPRHKSSDNTYLLEKKYVHVFQPGEVRGTEWKFDANYRLAVCTNEPDKELYAKELTAEDINSVLL